MRKMNSFFFLFSSFCFFLSSSLFFGVEGVPNGLGVTPPMGWNTWCTQGPCSRDYCWENEIKQVADAMVQNGMKDAGYQYINMDDCWADKKRDSNGNLQPDPSRFPNGMKPVADYVHSKGFKLGLYTDSGTHTCVGGRPGSYGHYQQDAETFASWGIDYVKMDWCNTKIDGVQLEPTEVYKNMSDALNATGRPIFFNICEWGYKNPWLWGAKFGNSWRTGSDHHDQWDGNSGVAAIIEHNVGLSTYSGPFGWNDPDFLMTGGQGCWYDYYAVCPGMTHEEYKTEFSMWCMLSAPLLVATDIREPHFDEKKKSIILNKEVIAIDQDPLGVQGDRIALYDCPNGSEGNLTCQIWTKPLSGGDHAIALYNKGADEQTITVDFKYIGKSGQTLSVRDLWQHKDMGKFKGQYTANVPSHGVVLIRVSN